MDTTNTAKSFRDKWTNNIDLAFGNTQLETSDIGKWILSRNGWNDHAGLQSFLASKGRLLDAGCGNGRVTALLATWAAADAEVVGIDLVAADVASSNLRDFKNVRIQDGDLLGSLQSLGKFDFVYCQEVLHHTGNAEKAFYNLCSLLDEGGEIAIYVYRLKAAIREFTDDFVRERIAGMSYGDAMQVCEEITDLGKALSEQEGFVDVPSVGILGIEGGRYTVQRFVYHFFAKLFWNPELDHAANVAINYDWYHPENCSRHSEEEVLQWFRQAGLEVVHRCVDPYGITVRGRLI
jgi:SAM-dependent methyltransferase